MRFSAWLETEIPPRLDVGGGDVLSVGGRFRSDEPVREIRVSAGASGARALHGIAPPGELIGADWWSAIVPVPAVAEEREVEIAIRARLAGGGEAEAVLARTRVQPPAARASPPAAESLVAICMATHDPDPDLFRAQVESIRAQAHPDWRCVISDDASSAASLAEIERVLDGDKRFTLIRNSSRVGFYRNFERALGAAPADAPYIALADQDDRWHPDKLGALLAALGDSAVLAHSDARVVDAEGRELAPSFWPHGPPGGDRLEDLIFANSVTGASCLFRREVLDCALPFPSLPGKPFHDRWLALAAAATGPLARVDRPLYDYVQHPASAFGHARATGADRRSLATRLASVRTGRPNWRQAHDEVVARSVAEAIVLRLRAGDSIEPRARRALRAVEGLPRSAASLARVAARHAVRAPRRRPGLEGALLRGVAWRAIARRRGKRAAAANPPPARTARRPGPGAGRARIGITVTDRDPGAAFGDLHTATELAEALERLGHRVSVLELAGERWRDGVKDVDVLISLHDRLDLGDVPDRVLTAAWIRNWTDRWLGRPWFGAYETVFASSQRSVELIAERSGVEATLFPLATNPERFRPVPAVPELRADLMFAGNHWGGERAVADVLPRLAESFGVKVYGKGWDEVPGMAALSSGPLAYGELTSAYASSALVVDDSAPHTLRYGSVNSRVFDALACGVPVASNDPEGVRALFGAGFPVWSDAESLGALALEARESPERLRGLAAELRAEVLNEHTYEHRARRLSTLLALA